MIIDMAKNILKLPLYHIAVETGVIFGTIGFIWNEWYDESNHSKHSFQSISKNLLIGLLAALVISAIFFILFIGVGLLLTKFGIIQQ